MILRKEMSIGPGEFARGMARLDAQPVRGQRGVWRIGQVHIMARELPALRRGVLKLPRLEVVLDLSALPEPAARCFVQRFERMFQRGGG